MFKRQIESMYNLMIPLSIEAVGNQNAKRVLDNLVVLKNHIESIQSDYKTLSLYRRFKRRVELIEYNIYIDEVLSRLNKEVFL